LSTLHAKNAQGTIHRLLEMGLNKTDIKQSLIAVAALQLVPVQLGAKVTRRAAILELLDEGLIENILHGGQTVPMTFHTFDHLRKKAYAYGFICKEILMA